MPRPRIAENTSTASAHQGGRHQCHRRCAGTNILALTGTDAAFFEIVGSALYLKAGTVLDFESKASYAVAVTVDDPTVGATPDATSTIYALNVVDTTAPATPAAPADGAVINGYVNAAHDTASQALSGSAENGSTVTIYDNGTQVGTATANASTGAWSLPIGQLADGSTHSYTVTATDAAGNVSQPSAALSFVVDTDTGEQSSLKLTVATTAISAATAASVPFAISGLESEDAGTVTFTDVNHKTVVVNVTGGQTSYTANLSSLADGTVTSSLAVNADTAGNTFTPVAGTSVTLTQLDHWTKTSGGNWTTASSWTTWNGTHALPTGTIDADFDTSGTYTVSITTAATAYGLLLNDSGATVSDNGGGTLTLAGTGGSTNPNGVLTINAGTFALAGGVLKSGPISVASGGKLLVSAGYTGLSNAIVDNGSIIVSGKNSSFASNISGSGAINIQNGAVATFNGAITGAEIFTIANTSKAIVNTTITGTGSFSLSGNGSLEFGAADSENVTFTSGATGTLKLDHSLTAPFTGYLSGLSTKNAVDLADLSWTQGKMKATFSGNTSGGTLTVTNGKNSVALKLSGNYTHASWTLSKDATGGTRVVDPSVAGSLTADAHGGAGAGIDLSSLGFGAHTTLAYSANSDNTGGHPDRWGRNACPECGFAWPVYGIELRYGERWARWDPDHRSRVEPAAASDSSAWVIRPASVGSSCDTGGKSSDRDQDLTEEDRNRLNGGVERIVQKKRSRRNVATA